MGQFTVQLILSTIKAYTKNFPATPDQDGSSKTDFLGMSLTRSQATAGGWVLLALALVFLITTIFFGVKFSQARRKAFKSSSEMELK